MMVFAKAGLRLGETAAFFLIPCIPCIPWLVKISNHGMHGKHGIRKQPSRQDAVPLSQTPSSEFLELIPHPAGPQFGVRVFEILQTHAYVGGHFGIGRFAALEVEVTGGRDHRSVVRGKMS